MKGDREKVGKARTDPRMHTSAPRSARSSPRPRASTLVSARPSCHHLNPAFGSRIRGEGRQMSTLPYPDHSKG